MKRLALVVIFSALLLSCSKQSTKVYDTNTHTLYFLNLPLDRGKDIVVEKLLSLGFKPVSDEIESSLRGEPLQYIQHFKKQNCTKGDIDNLFYGMVWYSHLGKQDAPSETNTEYIVSLEYFGNSSMKQVSVRRMDNNRDLYLNCGAYNEKFAPLFSGKKKTDSGYDFYYDNFGNALQFYPPHLIIYLDYKYDF